MNIFINAEGYSLTYTILFSPVGTTDPVTKEKNTNNYHDGSIVQLIKKLKPNEVYLYFSKSLKKREEDTNQVINYLNTLSKEANIPLTIKSNLKENIQMDQPQLFDAFYNEFQNKIISVIDDCQKNTDEPIKMYLNISSGTPAMKSTLFLLANTLSYSNSEIIAYQVYTPDDVTDKKYLRYLETPSEELYKTNIDNDNNNVIEKRTHEAEAANLNNVLLHNQVKKFIEKCNYNAAYSLIEQDKNINPQAKELINFGKDFRNLTIDDKKYQNLIKKYHYDQEFLVSNIPNMPLSLYEYLLNLNILEKNNEITNFIRALSPALFKLFIQSINKYFGKEFSISIIANQEQFIPRKDLNNKIINKLQELDLKANNKNAYEINTTFCLAVFSALYSNKNKDQTKTYTILKFLRLIEKSSRNLVAHNITPLTNNDISSNARQFINNIINRQNIFDKKIFTNFSLPNYINTNYIMRVIKELCKLLYGDSSQKMWNKFDCLNQEIINHIDR